MVARHDMAVTLQVLFKVDNIAFPDLVRYQKKNEGWWASGRSGSSHWRKSRRPLTHPTRLYINRKSSKIRGRYLIAFFIREWRVSVVLYCFVLHSIGKRYKYHKITGLWVQRIVFIKINFRTRNEKNKFIHSQILSVEWSRWVTMQQA